MIADVVERPFWYRLQVTGQGYATVLMGHWPLEPNYPLTQSRLARQPQCGVARGRDGK